MKVVRDTLLLLPFAQGNTEWSGVFGGGDLWGERKVVSKLLLVLVGWNTAGETHFSLPVPRVLRWEFCGWEEADPNFKWCQRVWAQWEVHPQSLEVPHSGIPLLGPQAPPKHRVLTSHFHRLCCQLWAGSPNVCVRTSSGREGAHLESHWSRGKKPTKLSYK